MQLSSTLLLTYLLAVAYAQHHNATSDGTMRHGRHHPINLTFDDAQELRWRHHNFSHYYPARPGHHRRAATARSLTPAQVRNFYNAVGDGTGQTVAIVVAYGASSVENDLQVFSSQFSLPVCTTSNGCFKKVDQNGGSNIPGDDPTTPVSSSWSGETNLDVQWVHSMAPQAKIILVCANSPSNTNLFIAVQTAMSLTNIVSMSWGGSEGSTASSSTEAIFSNGVSNGISFFAATGDNGSKAGYPATSSYVIAVGGTTTYQNNDGTLASESAWSGSSGGCSSLYPMSNAQKSNSEAVSRCGSQRATPDVAFNGDPTSGAPVYLQGKWYQFGGTSLATPLASGRLAASKSQGLLTQFDANYAYSRKAEYRDITSGANDNYQAVPGYDLSTGLGVWVDDASGPSVTPSTTKSTTISPTFSTTAASRVTTQTAPAATFLSTTAANSPTPTTSTRQCGIGEVVCADAYQGPACYAPSRYDCVLGDDNKFHLCAKGLSACGHACYPANQYTCSNGILRSRS